MSTPIYLDDAAIVSLYQQRNETAIEYTAIKYGARLQAVANNLLADEQAAEECENDTYFKTWQAIPPHDPTRYFFAFLAKITRQLALDVCRGRERQKRSANLFALTDELQQCIAAPDDVESTVDAAEWGRALSAFVRSLPLPQQGVFVRRYWYLDSVAEIAKRYGFSESKVKMQLQRTRSKLQTYLNKEGVRV